MRRAARTDANHSDIIDTLRKAGCTVLDMSRLGNGAPDIALGYGGLTMFAEIKNGAAKDRRQRVLRASQVEWMNTWTGGCRLILSPSDALEAASTLRRWAMMLRQPQTQSVYESGAD